MTYTVYATLPDGRKLKYGKALNTAAEVSAAMAEMKNDLKAAGLTAKVGYVNNNPPKAVPKTPSKTAAAPKAAKVKAAKPDVLDSTLLDLMKARYDKEPTGYHAREWGRQITLRKNREAMKMVKTNVTLRQVINSINNRGDTFKLITGNALKDIGGRNNINDAIVDMTCAIVGQKLGLRSYEVYNTWDPYGYRKDYGYKDDGKQITKKEKAKGELPKVGTILYASWGYDQTNIDYYKITATKGNTMVHIVPISEKYVRQGGPAGDEVLPDPTHIRSFDVLIDKEHGDPPTKGKWCRWNFEYGSIRLTTNISAHLWDGKAHYQTDPMFGH